MIAEFRHEEVDKPASVTILLRGHLVEHFRAGREVIMQTVGEIGENACVLLLVADREGQNFAL